MPDVIERVGGSMLQHGKHNDRVYLMKLAEGRLTDTVVRLDRMATRNGYTKVIAKVPTWAKPEFAENGYSVEAAVPRLYNGSVDALFMGKYFSDTRRKERHPDTLRDVLSAAKEKAGEGCTEKLDTSFTWSIAGPSDAGQICVVYKEVFESYPFPIHDESYIVKTMNENIVYFCVRRGEKIVSVASSEMDPEHRNVEMTDFATLPKYRSRGFAAFLLRRMEEEMRSRGILVAYTIARALSYGMNITFAKLGYTYAGTLTNNTAICGETESMNVWYKLLRARSGS